MLAKTSASKRHCVLANHIVVRAIWKARDILIPVFGNYKEVVFPIDAIFRSAPPMVIASLFLDGRVNDAMETRLAEPQQATGSVGRLFGALGVASYAN